MKTILASAYAVNPYKGSEDGMGWNFTLQIAKYNKVIAVTRKNNREAIERYMKENPNEVYQNMTFMYFDLPKHLMFWKRGSKGAMLYYVLWQKALVKFIEKSELKFDLVHNLNFHNDWTPSYLWKLDKPFVWGPIGHHPVIPEKLMQNASFGDKMKDKATWLIKRMFWKFSFGLKKTVNHAQHVMCMNTSVADKLNLNEEKFSIMPSVASEDLGFNNFNSSSYFNVLSVGRFVPLKGFDLTIHAFAKFIHELPEEKRAYCRLNLVGKGPQEESLKALVKTLKIETNVKFIPWMERAELLKLYTKSKLFLFPSHEGAGMVVSEAMSFGLPVVCLNNVGPGEFINSESGIAVPVGKYEETTSRLANAVEKIYKDDELQMRMSAAARNRYENHFSWDVRGEQLKTIYASL